MTQGVSFKGRGLPFSGVAIFTATTRYARDEIGGRINRWLAVNPALRVINADVVQSSDAEFHCVSIAIWYSRLGNESRGGL